MGLYDSESRVMEGVFLWPSALPLLSPLNTLWRPTERNTPVGMHFSCAWVSQALSSSYQPRLGLWKFINNRSWIGLTSCLLASTFPHVLLKVSQSFCSSLHGRTYISLHFRQVIHPAMLTLGQIQEKLWFLDYFGF